MLHLSKSKLKFQHLIDAERFNFNKDNCIYKDSQFHGTFSESSASLNAYFVGQNIGDKVTTKIKDLYYEFNNDNVIFVSARNIDCDDDNISIKLIGRIIISK